MVANREMLKLHLQQELSKERNPSTFLLLQRNSPSEREGDPCWLLPLIWAVSEGEEVWRNRSSKG